VKMMKESIKSNGPRFSARRMVKEYVARYYPSLLEAADAGHIRPLEKAEPRAPAWEPWVQEKARNEGD